MPVTLPKKGAFLLINGLDVSAPADYISEQSTPNSENFLTYRSLLSKRYGSIEWGSSLSEEIMLGTEFSREGVKYNIRIGLTKIQQDVNGTWTDIGHTDFTGSTDDLFSIATPLLSGKQILVVTNGIDSVRKWTASGNTAVLGGTPPIGKYVQEYKTYTVMAHILGGTDVDTRVQWSDTADPENWSTGNSGTVDLEEDGGAITGLALFGNYISVHKENSIYIGYLVNTNAIFKFDRKPTGAGTVANNSIVNLPTNEQIFLASDGIRIFNGIGASLLDSPINDEIRDTLNQERRHKAWGLLVKELDEVWLGIPIGDDSYSSTVYKFNYVRRVLYKDKRLNATAAWKAAQTSSITWDNAVGTWDEQVERWNSGSFADNFPLVYIGFSTGSTLYLNKSSTDDDGVAINAFWQSKDFQDEELRLVRWQEIEIWARGGTITVDYSIDEGETWSSVSGSPFTLNDSFPLDSSPVIGYVDVVSSKIRVRFTNNELGEVLEVKQFTVGGRPREFRK